MTRSHSQALATTPSEVLTTYGPDVCTDHASLLVTADYHGSKEEDPSECSEPLACGHASDVEFSGYQDRGAVFTTVWRATGALGDVWARQYRVASRSFGPATAIGGASGEVLVDTNWVRRLGFDPNCELSPSGCGSAIWQTTTEGGDVLRWRQFTPDGTFGALHAMLGFHGSGEVGCRGEAGSFTCTRLLAFISRDNRPDYPDTLQTVQLDANSDVIPGSLQTIYTVAKPVRLFQTAVAYASAEERFLVGWAESRSNGAEEPRTNGALKYLFVDVSGALLGSHPQRAGYCEGDPSSEICPYTKSDGVRHNGTCGCKGFFLAAAPDLSAAYQDRYRFHHYRWRARVAPDEAAITTPNTECASHCPMAPALLEGSQLVGYLGLNNRDEQYRYLPAGEDTGLTAGVLFHPRLPGGVWTWRGQGARSALSLDRYGRLVRRPIVAGLSAVSQAEENRLYLSLLQNVHRGCP